ncbi:hypothetical protein OH818_05020 [Jiella pelagia]|uniref:Uncharacterized protein n=1 Tax=Jiella pelagia TaxID=2986949 RepID=A0ABY7C1G1_9HYPH|nr:hypothetical protein [Jiella pelagia]WAP69597.1 hypothetical protein OH818_05020 [Jiella pelagia]
MARLDGLLRQTKAAILCRVEFGIGAADHLFGGVAEHPLERLAPAADLPGLVQGAGRQILETADQLPELLLAAAARAFGTVSLRPIPANDHEAGSRQILALDPLQDEMATEAAAILSEAPSLGLVTHMLLGAPQHLRDLHVAGFVPVEIGEEIAADDLVLRKASQAFRTVVPAGDAALTVQQYNRVVRHTFDELPVGFIREMPVRRS